MHVSPVVISRNGIIVRKETAVFTSVQSKEIVNWFHSLIVSKGLSIELEKSGRLSHFMNNYDDRQESRESGERG